MPGDKFHERFDISVGLAEARRRFVNRVYNFLLQSILQSESAADALMHIVCNGLGERFQAQIVYTHPYLDKYLKGDFHLSLMALEALYQANPALGVQREVDAFVSNALQASEVDLGVQFKSGKFLPTGAGLLDERLVNDPLRWLRANPDFKAVLQPFERGLSNFIQAEKNPNLLADVVNAMHESMEALAQIITARPSSDLSANRELFLAKINAADAYKKIMKDYIEYANSLVRHARDGKPKAPLSRVEIESFIYMTGLFIRLATNPVRP